MFWKYFVYENIGFVDGFVFCVLDKTSIVAGIHLVSIREVLIQNQRLDTC